MDAGQGALCRRAMEEGGDGLRTLEMAARQQTLLIFYSSVRILNPDQ